MTARFTDRTFRIDSAWCKVTRDNKDRTFTFCKGYKGEYRACVTECYPFRYFGNWKEAEIHAFNLMVY